MQGTLNWGKKDFLDCALLLPSSGLTCHYILKISLDLWVNERTVLDTVTLKTKAKIWVVLYWSSYEELWICEIKMTHEVQYSNYLGHFLRKGKNISHRIFVDGSKRYLEHENTFKRLNRTMKDTLVTMIISYVLCSVLSQQLALFIFLIIYLKGRVVVVVDIFHLLILSPNSQHIWGWARQKPGVWNSICVSHVGCRDPSTGALICCLPGCISRKLSQNWSSWGSNWHSNVRCGSPKLWLSLLHQNTLLPLLSFHGESDIWNIFRFYFVC